VDSATSLPGVVYWFMLVLVIPAGSGGSLLMYASGTGSSLSAKCASTHGVWLHVVNKITSSCEQLIALITSNT
jgi:hypothetical protein